MAAAGLGPAGRGRPRRPPHVPRRPARRSAVAAAVEDLFDEAADAVEVVRRLWDSWEDDAVIKDVATGRFVDRDKLHYIDFEGRFFRVKGPSIVPRPPQGHPLVVALAHSRVPFEFAARSADVVFVTPADRRRRRTAGWPTSAMPSGGSSATRPPLLLFADLVVFLDDDADAAAGPQGAPRRARRPRRAAPTRRSSSARPAALADQLLAWQAGGLDGFRLRPGVIGHDLDAIVDGVVPALQARGAFRSPLRRRPDAARAARPAAARTAATSRREEPE